MQGLRSSDGTPVSHPYPSPATARRRSCPSPTSRRAPTPHSPVAHAMPTRPSCPSRYRTRPVEVRSSRGLSSWTAASGTGYRWGSKATEFRVPEAIRGVEVGRIVRIVADPRVCSSELHGPDVCRRGFVAGAIGGEGDKVLVGFRNSGMPGPARVPDRPRRLAAPGAFATVHPSAAWSRLRRNPGARVVRGPRGSPRRRRPTSSRRRGRRCRPRRAAPRARRASCCRRTARD